jgi:hypothetical protein
LRPCGVAVSGPENHNNTSVPSLGAVLIGCHPDARRFQAATSDRTILGQFQSPGLMWWDAMRAASSHAARTLGVTSQGSNCPSLSAQPFGGPDVGVSSVIAFLLL